MYTARPSFGSKLDCLVKLHGRDKINAWHDMANGGRMPQLVDELLVDHYDPAYLRSIDRNFTLFDQAEVLELSDIGAADFLAAAHYLHAQ